MTDLKPDDLIDVTIKGVRLRHQASDGIFSIWDEHEHAYPMPPQAAITPTSDQPPADTALQERINAALRAIDRMTDEQTLDPWTAYNLRKRLDPNPRHWPPQAGDVWDDGMPFGGSLWFARKLQADGPGWNETAIVMTNVEADRRTHSPDELLQSAAEPLKLVYRDKDGRP